MSNNREAHFDISLYPRAFNASLHWLEEIEVVKASHLQAKLCKIQKLAYWKIIVQAF